MATKKTSAKKKKSRALAQVAIVMGSRTDLPTLEQAAEVLKQFKIPFEMRVVSAHRTPQYMAEYAQQAAARGIRVIIAGAGGAAHLPGMVAAHTALPVIGVPVATTALVGMDALLSIVQMPAGVPVATVAINNAKNAAFLAARILAGTDPELAKRLLKFADKKRIEVLDNSLIYEPS